MERMTEELEDQNQNPLLFQPKVYRFSYTDYIEILRAYKYRTNSNSCILGKQNNSRIVTD